MRNTPDLDNELNDVMLAGGQTPADVQAALERELNAELTGTADESPARRPARQQGRPTAAAKPTQPVRRSVPEPQADATLGDRPTMNVNVEYVRSDSTKMLNARIDEDLMTHLNLVSAVNKARKTCLPTVRSIIETALLEWFERNAPIPGREQGRASRAA